MTPSIAVLKRADSFPAHLPSQTSQPTEIPPIRHPITRPKPDAKPPVSFAGDDGAFEGGLRKIAALNTGTANYSYHAAMVGRDPEFRDMVYSKHPNVDRYDDDGKDKVFNELLNHPRFRAEVAKARNEVGAIPTGATATRKMQPDEQKFLTLAFRQVREDVKKNPFHIHGETSIVGNKDGEPTWMQYYPGAEAKVRAKPGDKFNVHTHPPLMEPLTSSASEADHLAAPLLYRYKNNRMSAYVTNGKDVLHIQPDSLELVKLVPDPTIEGAIGKFPVAFTLPDPQQPPRPFSNHEAPATFRPWLPPKSQGQPER